MIAETFFDEEEVQAGIVFGGTCALKDSVITAILEETVPVYK